jgi:hypothetical protein
MKKKIRVESLNCSPISHRSHVADPPAQKPTAINENAKYTNIIDEVLRQKLAAERMQSKQHFADISNKLTAVKPGEPSSRKSSSTQASSSKGQTRKRETKMSGGLRSPPLANATVTFGAKHPLR